MVNDALERWVASLEKRHRANLTFAELSRALRALSATYVERRHRLMQGAALAGAGKRAAFALFYGPLHFMLVERIVAALPHARARGSPSLLIDLGCGTGAAGAAWAVATGSIRRVIGIDRNAWALAESARTCRDFGLSARMWQGDLERLHLPKERACLIAAFTLNELPGSARDRLLRRLVERAAGGDQVLIVEPIARSPFPWWTGWRSEVEAAGGRADEWRFAVDLPEIVQKLDRAAGLNHRELTGRTLWLSSGRVGA